MNWTEILKKWALPAIILVVAFTFLPSIFTTYLGPIIGTLAGEFTGYFISFMVALICLYVLRMQQMKKYITD